MSLDDVLPQHKQTYKTNTSSLRKHGKLVKMRAVKNLLKPNYGRPFFVCSERSNPCSFWVWGDVRPIAKPKCRHGFPCVIRKVKKETINEDRLFFCCAQEDSCNYFEWVPEEPLITMLNSPNQKSSKMKNAKNNTQQMNLSRYCFEDLNKYIP